MQSSPEETDSPPLSSSDKSSTIREAMRFYGLAECAEQALRVAQQHDLESELMSLALSSSKSEDLCTAARYYENRRGPEHAAKAVTLYRKAGDVGRAMELCFSARLFEPLRQIVHQITSDKDASAGRADPATLARCASFFMENEQFSMAVELLCISGQHGTAVDLCYDHKVVLSEEMAEKLTPDKDSVGGEQRLTQLRKIAKLCKEQGNFQVACKKYTQAGDKLKAMKCLLKSGDTEKIAFFAGTARMPEIYVIAANYLQGLDWSGDGNLRKQILGFYSKAKDFKKMGAFYQSMAEHEIDVQHDYEKATNFLGEALKVLQKGQLELSPEHTEIERHMQVIDRFLQVRNQLSGEEQVQACQGFLGTEGVNQYVRHGDIYALMISGLMGLGAEEIAGQAVASMKENKIRPNDYLPGEIVERLEAVARNQENFGHGGQSAHGSSPGIGSGMGEVDEDIDEEISDEE